jgi:hypothetical protein
MAKGEDGAMTPLRVTLIVTGFAAFMVLAWWHGRYSSTPPVALGVLLLAAIALVARELVLAAAGKPGAPARLFVALIAGASVVVAAAVMRSNPPELVLLLLIGLAVWLLRTWW